MWKKVEITFYERSINLEEIMPGRKVILFIAMSLDGYIAGTNDDLDFLSIVEQEGEDYGYAEFVKTVDTIIVGRRTYDKVLSIGFGSLYAEKNVYVITRTAKPAAGNVKFYTGDLKELVSGLKNGEGKNIFVDGGAEIIHQLLKEHLMDECYISVIPILLGDGIRLFRDGRPEQELKFIDSKHFDKGLVQIHYEATDHSRIH